MHKNTIIEEKPPKYQLYYEEEKPPKFNYEATMKKFAFKNRIP